MSAANFPMAELRRLAADAAVSDEDFMRAAVEAAVEGLPAGWCAPEKLSSPPLRPVVPAGPETLMDQFLGGLAQPPVTAADQRRKSK